MFFPYLMVGPACTPTRVSLFTGRNYLETGVWGVGSCGKVRRDETLIPRFFTPSGYHTWAFGKMDDQIARLLQALDDAGQAENTILLFMSDNGSLDAMDNQEMAFYHLTCDLIERGNRNVL